MNAQNNVLINDSKSLMGQILLSAMDKGIDLEWINFNTKRIEVTSRLSALLSNSEGGNFYITLDEYQSDFIKQFNISKYLLQEK
jgi:hypothetical protein